jgi:hypothetical protein
MLTNSLSDANSCLTVKAAHPAWTVLAASAHPTGHVIRTRTDMRVVLPAVTTSLEAVPTPAARSEVHTNGRISLSVL